MIKIIIGNILAALSMVTIAFIVKSRKEQENRGESEREPEVVQWAGFTGKIVDA